MVESTLTRRAHVPDHDDQAEFPRGVQGGGGREDGGVHGAVDQHARGEGAVVGYRDGDGGGVGGEGRDMTNMSM
jgi:hypothetical protein